MDTGKIKQRLNRHRKMVEDCEALRRELDFAIEKYGAMCGEQGGVVYPQDIEGICVAWGAQRKEEMC